MYTLQVVTTYFSAEYNVSTSALYPVLYGLLPKLNQSEDNVPCIKTKISTEITIRWSLQSLSTIGIGNILTFGNMYLFILTLSNGMEKKIKI